MRAEAFGQVTAQVHGIMKQAADIDEFTDYAIKQKMAGISAGASEVEGAGVGMEFGAAAGGGAVGVRDDVGQCRANQVLVLLILPQAEFLQGVGEHLFDVAHGGGGNA